jgi:plasmid stabilization system protein ParE
LIDFTTRATRQLRDLRHHYENLDRYEAISNLNAALYDAIAMIERDIRSGRPFPAEYETLARPGQLWVHSRRYWIRYRVSPPPVITAVFYDQANIPARV